MCFSARSLPICSACYGPRYCTNYTMHYPTYPSISLFTFNTLVFIAVSYRLAADAVIKQSWRSRLQSVATEKACPASQEPR